MSRHELDPIEDETSTGSESESLGDTVVGLTVDQFLDSMGEDSGATVANMELSESAMAMFNTSAHGEAEGAPETIKVNPDDMQQLLHTTNRQKAPIEHTLQGNRTAWDTSKAAAFHLKGHEDGRDEEMHTMQVRPKVIDPDAMFGEEKGMPTARMPAPSIAQATVKPIFQYQPTISGVPTEEFVGEAFLSPDSEDGFEVESLEVVAEIDAMVSEPTPPSVKSPLPSGVIVSPASAPSHLEQSEHVESVDSEKERQKNLRIMLMGALTAILLSVFLYLLFG